MATVLVSLRALWRQIRLDCWATLRTSGWPVCKLAQQHTSANMFGRAPPTACPCDSSGASRGAVLPAAPHLRRAVIPAASMPPTVASLPHSSGLSLCTCRARAGFTLRVARFVWSESEIQQRMAWRASLWVALFGAAARRAAPRRRPSAEGGVQRGTPSAPSPVAPLKEHLANPRPPISGEQKPTVGCWGRPLFPKHPSKPGNPSLLFYLSVASQHWTSI